MSLQKWAVALAALTIVFFLLSVIEVFPDPYHEEGDVTFYKWIIREIKEIPEGER